MKHLFDKEQTSYSDYDSQAESYQRESDSEQSVDAPETKTSEATTIYEGMHLVGQVEGTHDFYLNGGLEGKVNITELFKVGRKGRFKGEVKAKFVIIDGEADGKVTADGKVEIRDTGHFKGDIVSPSIHISDKAFFQGKITMVRNEQDGSGQRADYRSPAYDSNTQVQVVNEEAAEELEVETESEEEQD